MHSLRKWFYRPKKEDSSKLALFYWADEELTMVAAELDSFDGRTDPVRCSILVSQLRNHQDKVLSICNDIMDDAIPDMRANRDFRAKFPDDVLHENLAGQLWFGAECLAAGSNIIHRELESASMRPLAKALTRSLDNVRCLLREQSLKNASCYSDKVREALRIFDRLFAEFELCYVSAMVPIKSAKEYHLQQEIVVLFSETLIRALKLHLVTQDMIDDYDPSLMFTIPRLAIVWGLLLYPDGPFNVERESTDMSELFRPFCNLLFKIRDLLWTLTEPELHTLEKMLCSQEEPKIDEKSTVAEVVPSHAAGSYIGKFYQKHLNCKQFIHDFYAYNFGVPANENSLPENSEKCLREETRSNDSKHSKRSRNRTFEFGMEFKQSSDIQENFHKPTGDLESDIQNLVSKDSAVPNCNVCDPNNSHTNENELNSDDITETQSGHFGSTLSDDYLRTNLQNDDDQCDDSLSLGSCRSMAKHINPERYTYRSVTESADNTTSSLERHLSRFQGKCTCGTHNTSQEHLTPSRELMRQVMRQVEIVPQGQQITRYGSSSENSPRAYHHGLLSQSFPVQFEHGNPSNNSVPEVLRGRHKSSLHYLRHRNAQGRLVRPDCDIAPKTRCFYTCNQANSQRTSDDGPEWHQSPLYSSPLMIPRLQRIEDLSVSSEATYSSCSSCQSVSSVSSAEWDSTSPDTSSYNSECQDDEEIALALQAAEIASRNKARSRFKSSGDLLHKLFVCISGVADQLQTNYASDLRNILKSVFDMNCTQTPEICDNSLLVENSDVQNIAPTRNSSYDDFTQPPLNISDTPLFNNNNLRDDDDDDDRDHSSVDSAEEVVPDGSLTPSLVISELEPENENSTEERGLTSGPPEWIPDEFSSHCMSCKLQFTILRRRHHCRNCGKIFCSRCSSNTIPLPRYGHLKPVRVCNQCFMYQLTNLVMQRQL